MKYINGKELMMFLPMPIRRLSVFEAETVDAALSMCAEAFLKLEEQFQLNIDFPTFKFQLLKTMGEFLAHCEANAHIGLTQPRARIADERYQSMQVDMTKWPKRMQKQNGENFFLIQYTLAYADILHRYLMDAGLPKEFSHRLAEEAMLKLALWMDENCIHKCEYACIRRSKSQGYCTLCSYMIQPLPCPLKKEISVQQLGITEAEIQCMRKEHLLTKEAMS